MLQVGTEGGAMAITPAEERLRRISKAKATVLGHFREGVTHEGALSRSIADGMDQTVADRVNLADDFLRMADQMLRARGDLTRAAIARYYYAMYHAMRAASYQHHRGDDYEDHSALSSKGVPGDYPNRPTASNTLKDARLLRNDADYDQYPMSRTHWRVQARSLQGTAAQFVADARAYIATKGNPYV